MAGGRRQLAWVVAMSVSHEVWVVEGHSTRNVTDSLVDGLVLFQARARLAVGWAWEFWELLTRTIKMSVYVQMSKEV